MKRKRPQRHRSAFARIARPAAEGPDERWCMDFVSDALADGRRLRVLTILDTCTRECLCLRAGQLTAGQGRGRGADQDRAAARIARDDHLRQRVGVYWQVDGPDGPTATASSSTSHGPASQQITPTSRHSTGDSGKSVYRNTGSCPSRMSSELWMNGSRTTIITGRTVPWTTARPESTVGAEPMNQTEDGFRSCAPDG